MTTLSLDTAVPPSGSPERAGSAPGGLDLEERLGCEVCDHDWDGHDAISRRYCQATQLNALSRLCICAMGQAAL